MLDEEGKTVKKLENVGSNISENVGENVLVEMLAKESFEKIGKILAEISVKV